MRVRDGATALVTGVLLVGCGGAPSPSIPPASTPSAAAPTTTSSGPAVQALLDEAGVSGDLGALEDGAAACAQPPPASSCRETLALARSVADRLDAAILASGDPTQDEQLTEYVESLDIAVIGIEAYCYGEGGVAVDPLYCGRFTEGIPAFVGLVSVLVAL